MRKALALGLLLATAACGGGEERRSSEDLKTFDVSEESAPSAPGAVSRTDAVSPPGIAPTAAPGVAFHYRYAFRLPAARIASVQEQHAQACEKLGVARCRITGMHYRQDGERDVEAQLAFKLDPALARAFGREGIEAVTRAEGELLQADITGTDVGSEIAAGTRTQANLGDELRRVEQQLARPGLSSAERVQLQQQAQALRDSIRGGEAQQTERRQQLANTPMVFDYEAGRTGSRVARALDDAGNNFLGALAMLLIAFVTLLPWIVALLLIWLGWRWINRRFPITSRASTPPEQAPPEA